MSEKKLSEVRIIYDYDGQWKCLEIKDADGNRISIFREQIYAFLRIQKVLDDMHEVQKLREQLNNLFSSEKAK